MICASEQDGVSEGCEQGEGDGNELNSSFSRSLQDIEYKLEEKKSVTEEHMCQPNYMSDSSEPYKEKEVSQKGVAEFDSYMP